MIDFGLNVQEAGDAARGITSATQNRRAKPPQELAPLRWNQDSTRR
ncbi:hypothetical protein SBV1_1740007 [Verrucomicrobia bacterium]|nr:hypothetical protein SBV1_1740007 [Verrucomicrobiota bacterium]